MKRFCLDTETGKELQYCIDLHHGKHSCPRLVRFSYSSESILLHESPFHCEASCILGINGASVVLLLYQEFRSIVLCRQASNPHQSTVWIISGLRTMVRIFARILAPGFALLGIGMSFCNGRASMNLHRFHVIRCFKFPRSPKIFG